MLEAWQGRGEMLDRYGRAEFPTFWTESPGVVARLGTRRSDKVNGKKPTVQVWNQCIGS